MIDAATSLGWFCEMLALIGGAYSLIAAVMMTFFFRARSDQGMPAPQILPSVSVLKPLSGDEPGLRAHLESFCRQDYPGEVQIIFGVQDPNDRAIRCVEDLQRELPDREIQLVIDTREYGANAKISNVINIAREALHDIFILADSDIGVTPSYLRDVVAALSDAKTGVVTCLYRGEPEKGIYAQLAAMAIDYHFLPSVVFGLATGRARPCFGATIALRRSVVERIGGFAAFANHLADDNAIGEAVRAQGLRVSVPPMVVTHAFAEQSLGELVSHELRWACTIRAVDSVGFAFSVVTHPIPFALMGAAVLGFSGVATMVLLLALVSRAVLLSSVDKSIGVKGGRGFLLAARDVLSFIIFLTTFFVRSVRWRSRDFRVDSTGMLSPLKSRQHVEDPVSASSNL
jgi:ceramide glucosyltransferase